MDLQALLAALPADPPAIDALCGRWHIVKTTLGMWRGRRSPTATYTRLPPPASGSAGHPAPARLRDEIAYRDRRGRPGGINGVDTQDERDPRIFRWRGSAWYSRWITSTWCFVDHDPAWAEWAVTYFSATPFTAAGLDIYARAPKLDDATIAAIESRLAAIPALGPLAAKFFAPA